MEIERLQDLEGDMAAGWETKKVSWKWRLKDSTLSNTTKGESGRNKESLLKMEIES